MSKDCKIRSIFVNVIAILQIYVLSFASSKRKEKLKCNPLASRMAVICPLKRGKKARKKEDSLEMWLSTFLSLEALTFLPFALFILLGD